MKIRIIKYLAPAIIFPFLLASCIKNDDDQELYDQSIRRLEQYIFENNITQEPTKTGLYYIPLSEGYGSKPVIGNLIEINYTGELLDGTIFSTSYKEVAKSNNIYYPDYIYGTERIYFENLALWGLFEGIGYMREGETAKLIIPPDLALGGSYTSLVPRYSSMVYNITLEEVISDPDSHEQEKIDEFISANQLLVDTMESGLYFIETKPGLGDSVGYGNKVSVEYTGYFLDGRVFNDNVGDSLIFEHPSSNIIEGFNEGLKYMAEGGEATIIIPYYLAYKETGRKDPYGVTIIPPYMTLVYDIKVLDVKTKLELDPTQ